MTTSLMNTWPISVSHGAHWTCMGIPDRLGDGLPWRAGDSWKSLEEIAGEDWTGSVLERLLPPDRLWMWSTRSELYRQTGLPKGKAQALVDSTALKEVVTHQVRLRQMTIAFFPPTCVEERRKVSYWAGADTEHIPDHLWASAAPPTIWELDDLVRWCGDSKLWTDPDTLPSGGVGRAVTMFDGQLSCAVLPSEADEVIRGLGEIAEQWHLRVIPGPTEYSWPTKV